MHTIRTLTDMLNPSFRAVQFGDEGAMITVTTRVRQAWTAIPPEKEPPYNQNDVGAFIPEIQTKPEDEIKKNPDMTIHTPWRETIYEMWNHVFYDVMRFLPEVGMGVGHFHPPSHDVMEVRFGEEG